MLWLLYNVLHALLVILGGISGDALEVMYLEYLNIHIYG